MSMGTVNRGIANLKSCLSSNKNDVKRVCVDSGATAVLIHVCQVI